MKPREIVFFSFGIVFAAVCIRLGFWQIQRLTERRALNAELLSRAETQPVDFRQLPSDTGAAHFRRVRLTGTWDFDHEIILPNRTRNGSPGVNIITPLLSPTRDSAILVNRGWVYAADGMTVDLATWREPLTMAGDGFVELYSSRQGKVRLSAHPNAFRWMDKVELERALPYPIASYYAVLIAKPETADPTLPPRVDVPSLDEGSHKAYAVQWFSFAAISIFGMILYSRRK